jgi:FkbM family methyltransferase
VNWGKVVNQVLYHALKLRHVQFDVAIGIEHWDPIGESIADHTFSFSPVFRLAFKLLRPGCSVIDLGAHIGTFSLAAAALGCQVVAVEASPYNVDLLKASVTRNKFNNVRIVPAAVCDHSGVLTFVPGGPFGFVSNPIMSSPGIEVPAVTVDVLLAEFGWDRVDLIKMDVEGSEIAAIRGMSCLLARADAPPIVYESNGHTLRFFGETPNRLIAALEKFGYTNYLVEPGRLVPIHSSDLQPECTVDCLAVKQMPGGLQDEWTISPLTLEETITRVLSSCAHTREHHRAYIARALARAKPSILFDRRVMDALEFLHADPNTDVRAAAAWFDRSQVNPVARLARFESLISQADVMLRGYVVRSKAPLIGGLIVWIHNNVTSHLREPYLDPIFERQVAFNRCLVQEMHEIATVQVEILQRLAYLEAQLSSSGLVTPGEKVSAGDQAE